ncbi:MAG: rhodanese-like domain-containing protein [Chloroflexota bacterium]|nr:rhodanese-like domain-containing protein [Chloroflexota bacterium]
MARRTINDLLADARARLHRLTAAEAYAAQQHGALLIDTRCAELRQRDGSVPGSIQIPLSVLFWRLDSSSGYDNPELSQAPDRQLILMCDHGYSSSLAAATLHDLGFENATDVDGGFQAWAAAGLPVARPAARGKVGASQPTTN